MADETDDFSQALETDNVDPSATDDPSEWDYFDPDESPDDEDVAASEGTDDEDDDTEERPDQEDGEDSEDVVEDQPAAEASHDAVVRLEDGTTTTVADLLEGRMLKADHTRKTQEVANRRKALEAEVSQLESITQAFTDHLAGMLPSEPDISLLHSDPVKYTQQKAIYDNALQQVQSLIEIGKKPKEISQKLSQADRQSMLAEENSRLIAMFPETGTQQGRQQFFGDVQQVANDLGFSNEELSQIADHRLFALAHWAKKGMAAEKAKASAKAKVEKAPKVPPRKPGQGARGKSGKRESMQRLAKSGSIEDAVRALME
jgi:hypothetical protein